MLGELMAHTVEWSRRKGACTNIQDGGSSPFPWHPYSAAAATLVARRRTKPGSQRWAVCIWATLPTGRPLTSCI